MGSGRKDIHKDAVPFRKDRQPTKAQRAKGNKKRSETCKKKRELKELLSIALSGNIEKDINDVLVEEMGTRAETLEEALHFVQIAKAISSKDTQAYMALMNVSGISAPVKSTVTLTKVGKDAIEETYE